MSRQQLRCLSPLLPSILKDLIEEGGRAEHSVFQWKEETLAQMQAEQKSTYCSFQQHKTKAQGFGTANSCSRAGRNAGWSVALLRHSMGHLKPHKTHIEAFKS